MGFAHDLHLIEEFIGEGLGGVPEKDVFVQVIEDHVGAIGGDVEEVAGLLYLHVSVGGVGAWADVVEEDVDEGLLELISAAEGVVMEGDVLSIVLSEVDLWGQGVEVCGGVGEWVGVDLFELDWGVVVVMRGEAKVVDGFVLEG